MIINYTGAAGEKSNDKIKTCRICSAHGFPHEPIEFQKVPGRILSDGSTEVLRWQVKNYFDGREHQHKTRELQ